MPHHMSVWLTYLLINDYRGIQWRIDFKKTNQYPLLMFEISKKINIFFSKIRVRILILQYCQNLAEIHVLNNLIC